jgi:hypothetical protein
MMGPILPLCYRFLVGLVGLTAKAEAPALGMHFSITRMGAKPALCQL